MRIALAAALLAAMTTEASACHRFAIWHFPFPQRCFAARHATRFASLRLVAPRSVLALRPSEPAVALPSLARADCDGGEADEPTRAHVLLRAALEAANGN